MMPTDRLYLDYNATAPLRPSVKARILDLLDRTGNASSVHAEGRFIRSIVEQARADVGRLVGAPAGAVTFTSGATEAAALALTPDLCLPGDAGPAARLLIGATEHAAVADGHRFASDRVATVPVDGDGLIDLPALAALVAAAPGRTVLALQAANSETGVVQPVAAAAAIVHARGGLLVCDAVQAAGRIDCDADALRADVVLLSAHKLGGPQGVGALVAVREGLRLGAPLVRGGGQERGLRGGTENAVGIAGFGVAAGMVEERGDASRIAAMRERLEQGLATLRQDAVVFGARAPRLPNTCAFAIPGVARDTLLIALDLAGVAVSTGSACSSGKVSRSKVLEAMGVDDHLSDGMIRVSLGWASTDAHVARFLDTLDAAVRRITRRGSRSAA